VQYIAVLHSSPKARLHVLSEKGWDVRLFAGRTVVASKEVQDRSPSELRDELLGHFPPALDIAGEPFTSPLLIDGVHGDDAGDLVDAELSLTPPGAPLTAQLIGSDSLAGLLGKVVPSDPPDQGQSNAGKDAGKPDGGASPPATVYERPELARRALGGLSLPRDMWRVVNRGDPSFAKEIAEGLYTERVAQSRRIGWILAPERELFELAKEGQAEDTACKLLKAKVDLAVQDVAIRTAHANQQSEVGLILGEFRKQAAKWRTLATWGVCILVITSLFAMAMTAYLATLLGGTTKLPAWAYITAIFVLALFAVSPAALLIIERPLKGIDEWKPETTFSNQPPAQPAAAAQPSATAAPTPTPTTAATPVVVAVTSDGSRTS
jgi:hypothetical protein